MNVKNRGPKTKQLAALAGRVEAARLREREVVGEGEQHARRLRELREREVGALTAVESAQLDGAKPPVDALAEVRSQIAEHEQALRSPEYRASVQATHRVRERRESDVTTFTAENVGALVGEVVPAVVAKGEEVRGHLAAASASWQETRQLAYQELDPLLRFMQGGKQRVPDSAADDSLLAAVERRIAYSQTGFRGFELVPKALIPVPDDEGAEDGVRRTEPAAGAQRAA